MPDTAAWLATAVEVVRRAGEMQRSRFGIGIAHEKKGRIDLVTDVDVTVERMFRALVGERHPEHQVLAEEFVQPGDFERTRTGYCWVFDPLDGTTNFVHGLPIFCASLALEFDGEAVLGAVYDPSRDELFTAVRGEGAHLNGTPLHVSDTPDLLDAMLVTGFPYNVHDRVDEIVGLFARFVGRARAVRRLGSAAIDLCWVAAGRMDGFWEIDLKPWDIAAGALIVAEAGGRLSDFDGRPFSSRGDQVLAANPALHAAMIDVIAHH